MNPQGGWTDEKTKTMFPEMFQDTSQWLDPAEEAKKREGLPYDETKRYDEKKSVEGYTPPGAGGAPARGGPPTRTQFEETFFKQHGNPFLMDPYAAVVKSDKSLPKLFNQVFQGQAVWSDLAGLSKEQRAYWEDIKKQHHERTYKAAVGKQKQLKDMYDMMMTRFDHEEKTRHYEEGKAEKAQIRAAAKADKQNEFTLHEALNDQGLKTWQRFYKDGRVEDTGKSGSSVTAEDHMTAAEKFVKSTFEKTAGGLDPRYAPLIESMAEGPEKERLKKQFTITLTQDQKDTHEKLKPAYMALINRLAKVGVGAPAPAQPAAKSTELNIARDIGALVQAKKSDHPKFKEAVRMFLTKYPSGGPRLQKALGLVATGPAADTAGPGEVY
jgi:hypothetical protein